MIDGFATQPQYVDHLVEIWRRIPQGVRGSFYATKPRGAWGRAIEHGIEVIAAPRPPDSGEPCLVAGFSDEVIARLRPIAFLEHGAGQHYGPRPRAPGGGSRVRVGLFLAPSQRVLDANAPVFPNAEGVVVGCPKLSPWWDGERPSPDPMTVAFTWHWECTSWPESRSAWGTYRHDFPSICHELRERGITLLGHHHPRGGGVTRSVYRAAHIETATHLEEVLDRASVLVADNTSAMYEFASLGRPVVVLNAPWYRKDVEHGLRFWADHRLGPVVDHPREVVPAVLRALQGDYDHAESERIVASTYGVRSGESAEIAAQAVTRWALRTPSLGPRRRQGRY